MNTISLIEKLKAKVKESNEVVDPTLNRQNSMIKTAKELNLKLRNYLEGDVHEKNSFSDAQEKLSIVKSRIENSKQLISVIKNKLLIIKSTYGI